MMAFKHYPQWALSKTTSGFWGADNWYYLIVLPAWANWENMDTLYDRSLKGSGYNYRYIRFRYSEQP